MNRITSIVFSKDRPLQLDLTLKSIEKNFEICDNIIVIYKASNEEYEKAYNVLAHEHKYTVFLQEDDDFLDLILKSLYSIKNDDYVCFFTDDNIMYRESKTTQLDIGKLFSLGVGCISLRLGLNITHRDGVETPQPQFQRAAGSHLIWNRMSVLAGGYFNYPLSVDGHIFETNFISSIMAELCDWLKIKNPNELEQKMQRYFFEIPALSACELQSCVVNTPNNRVQNVIKNNHGMEFPYHQDFLLDIFNKGHRLNLDDINFDVKCPHTELDILAGKKYDL